MDNNMPLTYFTDQQASFSNVNTESVPRNNPPPPRLNGLLSTHFACRRTLPFEIFFAQEIMLNQK